MPIDPYELIKLVASIFIIIVPGYLWSFLFSKHLTRLERFVFGFVVGIGVLIFSLFIFNIIFDAKITQTFTILLFTLYTIPVLVLYGLHIRRFGLPKIDLTSIKNKKFLMLVGILLFTAFMTFLPHLSNNCFLPFHVDEWIHWSYSGAVMGSGSTTFTNPYTGMGNIASPEIGFHLATSCIKWLSGSNLLTIFLFMPTIIGIFVSLTAFNIGERSKRKFGLESAFLVGFIPTTIRFLGPSFYVAVTLGLLLLIFIVWAGQLKKIQGALLMTICIWLMFIVHPPTALAGIIIMLIFPVFLAMEKEYKIAILTGIFSLISVFSIVISYYFTEIWDYYVEMFLQATSGKEYLLGLPEIWVNFEYLGILTWVLFIIGAYYSISIGKSLKRTLSFSSIAFIIIIGLYSKLNYGVPIIYERTFLYLFLLVTLVAGVGLSELRKTVEIIAKKNTFKKFKQLSKNSGYILTIAVCGSLLLITVPVHAELPYYQLIDEKDYEAFIWIENNMDDYRDENHSYEKAAVHPFKASPFSAITGLYTISSTMHPVYGYELHTDMEKFLNEKCVNTSFLEQHELSVIYGHCDNAYSEEVYENVYLYGGMPPTANFTYLPENPNIGDTVYFTSNFTTPSGRITMWEWDFGDGNTSYGETTGLEFDGVNDYAVVPNSPSLELSDAITIETWIKLNSDPDCDENNNWRRVFSKYGSWDIILEQNGKPTWSVRVDEERYRWFGSTPEWPVDEWVHVAWMYDGAKGELTSFFNGTKYTHNIDTTGDLDVSDNDVLINKPNCEACPKKGGNLPGAIRDIRIYNKVLTTDEILQNYNSTSDDNVVSNGLVSWWKMDEMGKTAQDYMGNNEATIFGAKWINDASHKYNQSGTYQVTLTVLNEKGLNYSISKNITVY